jgi:hypothetical protein
MTTHQINQQETYIFLVKENISLVRKLIKESKKEITPFDPNNTEPFYRSRARHLQTMALLGLTCEHLIKLVVLKRDYSINEVDYIKTAKKVKIKYINKTISFEKAIKLFKKSNSDNYFDGLKVYDFNPHDINYEYSYLGYKKIDPKACLNLIQKIRNNYIHKADSHGEMNGIVWYVFNYILWLARTEFPGHFKAQKFIGNQEIIELFK